MKTHYVVLTDADYNRSLSLDHADEMVDFDDADGSATDSIQDGCQFAYVYKLYKVYRAEEEEDVEVETVIVNNGGNR